MSLERLIIREMTRLEITYFYCESNTHILWKFWQIQKSVGYCFLPFLYPQTYTNTLASDTKWGSLPEPNSLNTHNGSHPLSSGSCHKKVL